VTWLSALGGVAKLATAVFKFCFHGRLIRAGVDQATSKAQSQVLEHVSRAQKVERMVDGNSRFARRLRARFKRADE